MKSIVYERPDGGVSIVHPVYRNKGEQETEDAFIDRVRVKDVPPDARNVRVIERAAIPRDRSFRNAWQHTLTVDMAMAREIHRNRLRDIRAPKLAALDVKYMKALEAGDTAACAAIAAKKQSLRDVTKDALIETAVSPDALKLAIPDCLKE